MCCIWLLYLCFWSNQKEHGSVQFKHIYKEEIFSTLIDQTAESEAATSEREGSTPPREHLTLPPHPSFLHSSPCSDLASSSCMPIAIAITGSSSFFSSPALPSSFLPSFKATLGSLFRNYNRSGFRQFDQMQGLHVRIGKEEGAVKLQGEPWGGLEWNYQFNGWNTARQWQTVDIKRGLSDFRRGRKVPQRASGPPEPTPPSLLRQSSRPKYIFLPKTLFVLVKNIKNKRSFLHLIHIKITVSSLLLKCHREMSRQREINMSVFPSSRLMTFP